MTTHQDAAVIYRETGDRHREARRAGKTADPVSAVLLAG
jgi:hypothetical protein